MKEAIQETYLDVEKLVRKCVWDQAKHTRESPDELLSDANLAFLKAYSSFNEDEEASFSTWVYTYVSLGLKQERRRRIRYYKRFPLKLIPDHDIDSSFGTQEKDYLKEYLEESSEDAKHIINLLVKMPNTVYMYVLWQGRKPTPTRIRVGLKKYLRKEEGWSHSKVSKAFDELRCIIRDEK